MTQNLYFQSRNSIGIIAFQSETQEPLQRIGVCIDVLTKFRYCSHYNFLLCLKDGSFFRKLFDEHRDKIPSYFPEGETAWTWEFHPTHAFSRMDTFLTRLNDIKDIFEIAREFLKIEKIEFGGPKGKTLGSKLASIFT